MSVVCSLGVQDQYSWCGFAKGSVFLEGFKVTTLVCCVFVIWFDYIVVYPVVSVGFTIFNNFWGLDVALGLRVNQYKLFV